jgi:hypothetical protein
MSSSASNSGKVRLRLLKVIVQPVLVIDDSVTLREEFIEPIVVSAKDWPNYSAEGFPAAFEKLRQEIEGEQASPKA